jgi:cytoskeletal protein CcmA (bactofilin family)
MAFSGGTFSRTFDCTTDRDNGVKILASKFDTELDGFATGLSTCILKDGTQTCTAAIPFAEGLTLPDNKTIVLGTNSDITIQYDESTNDSLEIAANVEGAALGIVLKADQGDDNADQHKLNIADGGTLTLGSKISGSFVSYLTHTPNSTVASSTTAVAGNLTVGGDLTLGSGAVISEAELEAIDGVTAGTVTASKAVIVDSNKDIASFRNVTLTGELDAGSLDVSGDADIDGTLETDALSINGTAVTATGAELNYSDTGAAVGTVVASKVVTADANKDVASFRNITLTGELDAGSLDVSGDADIDGTLEADAMTLNGTAITATATLDTGISNNNVPKFTSGVADNDFLRVDGTAIEGRSASEVLSDIAAAPAAGSSNIVTTGALNSGSITSGFGAIDNGSSNITTTGVGSFGSLDISGNIDVDGTTNLDAVDIDGAVDMASTLQVDGAITSSAGATITTADNDAQLTLKSTDADASAGPLIKMHRDSSSPADGDALGRFNFIGENDASEEITYARIHAKANDVTDGTEDGELLLLTTVAGTNRSRMAIGPSETVFNEDSVDVDFRVESNGNANMLFVDAGNDKIGVNTSTPASLLEIKASALDRANGIALRGSGANDILYMYPSADNVATIEHLINGSTSTGGDIVINPQGGNVGIGITPTSPLHVSSGTTGNVANIISTNTSYGNDVLQIRCSRSGASSEYNNLTVFDNNTTLKMLIRPNGNLLNVNNSYGSLSDQTLKENIVDSPSQWDDIKAVQVRKYNFIDSTETQLGVVAQELEASEMSGLVESVEMYSANEEDEPVRNGEFKKSVKYSVLHMKALKALQEAMTRIETLETKVAALEAGS